MPKKPSFTDPTAKTKKKKEWKNMSRKEKVTGIVGLIILALIVIGVINAIAGGNKAANGAYNATSTSNSDTAQSSSIEIQQPKPAPPPEPKVYQGTGDDVVTIQKPVESAAIVTFECLSCTSNTIVKTNGAESLLVNTIGSYSGSHLIDVRSGSITSNVTITAVGAWTLTVSGLDKATQVAGQPVSGIGDAVLHVTGNTSKAAISNTGESNFIVTVYPENGGYADLAVNTIGSYKGTVPMGAPAYVQIKSSGNWTITTK